jgi:hypothetical protein
LRKTSFLIATLLLFAVGAWATAGATHIRQKVVIGQVLDADTGAPVGGAAVRLAQLSTLTDADGYFRLTGTSGSGRLVVEAAGYYGQVRPLEWAWWQQVAVAKLQLRPTRLSGVVMDAWTGEPLVGAIVKAEYGPTLSDSGSLAATGSGGRFTLRRVVPPTEITVSAPGYLAWRSVLTNHQSLAPSADWQAALTPNTITGTVRAADTDEPLASVAVRLDEQTVATDALGRFQLHRVAPGAIIHISPAGEFSPTQVTYPGKGELIATVEPRRLTLTARDELTGAPLPGTVVHTSEISRTIMAEGLKLARIAPGTRLQLTREGYLVTEVTYQGEANLAVTLRPYAVQGVVRDASTGQPVPGATLYVSDGVLDADDSGFYRIPELPDDLQITVKAPGFGKTTHSLDAEATRCAQDPPTPGPLCLDLRLTPFQARGLYIPFGLLANPDKVRGLLDLVEGSELNALVVDVKGDRGYLAYDSQIPLAVELGVSGGREGWLALDELLAEAQTREIYTIARIVVFKDNPLALGRPELAVGRSDGTVWTDGEGLGWGNPFREEVWNYNVAIAQEVAALGFDEVQFDYLRFPSDGDIGAILYAEENTLETRTAAIREFTRRVTEALRPYGVFTSADVFGLTVWVDPESDMSIGQRVIDVAPLVDYLCPMVYPSTFRSGNLGYADPSARPYDVIYRSQLAAEARVPSSTRVRPWLQAYWYTLDEMLTQKQAADDANATGWTFWNAGGVYNEELFAVDE